MEESKKIILLDSKDESRVARALVIHKNTAGHYFLSSHQKAADMGEDRSMVGDRYSFSSLYSLSKIQAYILSNKKTDSWLFQNVLNKVLTKNEIELYRLTEDAFKTYQKIVKNDFELAKPEIEKREAYLQDKEKQKREAEKIAREKSQKAFSQKTIDYLKGFKEK